MNRQRELAVVSVSLVALLILFFNRAVFTRGCFFIQDIIYQFHPFRAFAAETLWNGALPLWNPYIYSGMPFLANMQSAVFYPFSILFCIFPFPLAIKGFVLGHLFLAGLFMYILLAAFGAKRAAALTAAVVFMFNGYMVTRIQFLSILSSAIWLPVILLFVVSSSRDEKAMAGAAGIAFALQFLAGHTQILLYGVFFVIACVTVTALAGKDKVPWRNAVLAALIALALSMVQFLPSLEFIANSIRGKGISYGEATLFSVRPRELINLISPFALKNPFMNNYENLPQFWQTCFYVGILPLGLAVLGIFSKRKRLVLFLLSFLALVIFLAFGGHNPLYGLFHRAFPLFRYPSAVMYLAVFIIALGAGLGMDSVCGIGKTGLFPALLLLVMTLELFVFGMNLNPLLDSRIFTEKGENIEFLLSSRDKERFYLTPLTQEVRTAGGVTFYDAWKKMKDNLYSNINMPFHLHNAGGQDVRIRWYDEYLNGIDSALTAREANNLLSVAGVRHILSRDYMRDKPYRLRKDGDVKIYENGNYLPKTYIARRARSMEREKILSCLKGGYLRRDEIIIEKRVDAPQNETETGEEPRLVKYEPERVRITANMKQPGWLVLSDVCYPGWRAYVDGKRTEIFRTNGIMRSVFLDKGRHTVEYVYCPPAFTIGITVTLAALLLTILML